MPKYTYNLAKAKQEMAKSKYPNGFTADLNTLQGFGFYNLSQVLARIALHIDSFAHETDHGHGGQVWRTLSF